jgi:hypothetical protein
MIVNRLALATSFAAGLAVILAATAYAVGASGSPSDRAAANLAALKGVNFVNQCGFSHRTPDDPIVAPGQPGASHDHSFVGATTTSAFSTLQSLVSSPTTCTRPGHTAAYWMPTLLVAGQPVAPLGATIYYRRETLSPLSTFPSGLRMIAGDAKATTPQPLRITYWNCGVAGGVPPQSSVPACPNGRQRMLRLHVRFPSCWDGVNLDSPTHKSHLAYPRAGNCPSTYPVAVPAITLIYRYPKLPSGAVTLASGGQYSAHADFFSSWDPATLDGLVDGCLNALRHCGKGT